MFSFSILSKRYRILDTCCDLCISIAPARFTSETLWAMLVTFQDAILAVVGTFVGTVFLPCPLSTHDSSPPQGPTHFLGFSPTVPVSLDLLVFVSGDGILSLLCRFGVFSLLLINLSAVLTFLLSFSSSDLFPAYT